MDSEKVSFHIVEYGKLRDEILLYTKREILVVFYVVLVNAGVLSWVIASFNAAYLFKSPLIIAAFVPLFFTLVGWRYYRVNDRATERIANYITILEKQLAADGLGWENSLRPTGKKQRLGHFFIGNVIFLILTLIASYSLALAVYGAVTT